MSKTYKEKLQEFTEDMTAIYKVEPAQANDSMVGGTHYKMLPIEPWEVIERNNMSFFEGNALKYIMRYKLKNGVEDLKKARHYLDKLIEMSV